ncbi:hypothetical protein GGR50DRAFT_699084 [Xylaria sp. CBS 124048]|nr:hypothetical protein GGR50DRAFT_699084 [Xylaria sp. CBS 124048]
MVNAGLAWILVDPKDRIVPYSWRHWVLKNKVPYSRFEDNMYIRRPPPPPPPVTPRTQPQAPVAISSAPAAVEKGSEALSTPIEYSNLLRKRKHISDEDDIIAKRGVPNGLSLVSPNVMATESLGKLKASTPRRGGGVDEEFKMMIKHGLFDGPIEGRIREIVEDSLKNGEIDTDIKLRNLIINTVRTSTADTKQVIQGLRKQVNSLEKKLETAMKNVQERDKLINDVTEGVASQRNELQQLKARLGLDAAPTSAPVSAPAPAPVTPGRHSSVAASVPAEISVSDSPIPIRYFGHSLQNRDVEEGICGNNRDARHADDDDDVVMMEAAPRNFWH